MLEAGVAPILPGARTATLGGDNGPITLSYNLESGVIWFASTAPPATTTLTFHARDGGSEDRDGGKTV